MKYEEGDANIGVIFDHHYSFWLTWLANEYDMTPHEVLLKLLDITITAKQKGMEVA